MVCPRCITAVKQVFTDLGMEPLYIRLGEVQLAKAPTAEQIRELAGRLKGLGFELLDDSRRQQIEQIKTFVIGRVHYGEQQQGALSDLLARALHKEYSQLSKLFSETEGITIEQFAILQRIEKVKELLIYKEMSLSEIANTLDYSSVAHLSSQFKKVTGLTPTQFKRQGIRRPLDSLH